MLTAEPTGGGSGTRPRRDHAARTTSGREAHIGYVHDGVNAFEHMTRIAEPLDSQALARRAASAVRSSMLLVGGQAGAGAGFNVVPGAAWFSG